MSTINFSGLEVSFRPAEVELRPNQRAGSRAHGASLTLESLQPQLVALIAFSEQQSELVGVMDSHATHWRDFPPCPALPQPPSHGQPVISLVI